MRYSSLLNYNRPGRRFARGCCANRTGRTDPAYLSHQRDAGDETIMALSLSSMIELCRVLRHYMGAGLTLVDAFKKQATTGDYALRPVAARLTEEFKRGSSVGDALDKEASSFPP